MAYINMIVCALVVCMLVVVPYAEAAGISCGTVASSLSPCVTYLKGGGAVSAKCCAGVKSLNSAASTSAARKAACTCIKSLAESYGANPKFAGAIPTQCGVNIGYPISYSVNCNSVK